MKNKKPKYLLVSSQRFEGEICEYIEEKFHEIIKLMEDSKKISPNIPFNLFSNIIAYYLCQLPMDEALEKIDVVKNLIRDSFRINYEPIKKPKKSIPKIND